MVNAVDDQSMDPAIPPALASTGGGLPPAMPQTGYAPAAGMEPDDPALAGPEPAPSPPPSQEEPVPQGGRPPRAFKPKSGGKRRGGGRRRRTGYAEGGDVTETQEPAGQQQQELPEDPSMDTGAAAPDLHGYMQGTNAIPSEHLDAILQRIAQLDPNQSEDVVNLKAIVQAAQSGDMDHAASILAGFRKRFDSLNAHAQGAMGHGELAAAAQLAGKAHSQVPDGKTVKYTVAPDGSGVTATVSPSGQTFQMNSQQFHDYIVGLGTSFDHILENGLEKNLAIASGRQGGRQGYAAGGPVRGYDDGGDVQSYASYPPDINAQVNTSYPPDINAQDDRRRQQEEEEEARQQAVVREVLDHTRDSYGLADRGPSREDISSETANLGLGGDRVAPLTGDETKEARVITLGGGGQGSTGFQFDTNSYGYGAGTAGAGGVYYPPGARGGGGGGGGRRRPSGGGGSRRSSGGDERASAAREDTGSNQDRVPTDTPYNYTTGYQQEPPTYTPQKPGDDLRRTDTEGNPIGPAMDQPVPEAAARGEPVRTDTSGRPIGGIDTRPDPNDTRAFAKREFPDDPAGQNAVMANQYLKGSQREFDTLQRAHQQGTLTPDMADRLDSLKKGRQQAANDWDAFAKDKGLVSSAQVIGGGAGGVDRKYGRDVRDADNWPTGVPRGGAFANVPWSDRRDFSTPVSFGPKGRVGRAGSQPVYDANNQTYDVNLRTGMPRAQQFQEGYQPPQRGQPGWTGTYQTRPVASTSQAPAAAATESAPVPMSPRGTFTDPNSPNYQPPAQAAPDNQGGPPGAVYVQQGWRPAPNIRGATSVPPPDSDQSPAAQAARAHPSAAEQPARQQMQQTLERQEKKDTLEREKLTTKDTPEARAARNDARIAGANFRALSTIDQKNTYLKMKDTWENARTSQRVLEMVERSGNAGMAEILKGYRARVMADPDAKPTEEELGAMFHAHQLVNRAPTTTPAEPASAAPTSAAPAAMPAPTAGNQPSSGNAPVKVTSPAQARGLPSGTRFMTPDGQIRVRP